MQIAGADETSSIPESIVSGRVAQLRMLTGLLQGLILYTLYWSAKHATWPTEHPFLFIPLTMVFLLVPALFISAVGHVNSRRLAIWMIVATVVCTLLTMHDVWRSTGSPDAWTSASGESRGYLFSWPLLFVLSIGLYVAHSLVLAASADNRRIAHYPTYFEVAWKLCIQIKFSLLFVGVLWLILWLGSALFMLVKLDFLRHLLSRPWFFVTVTAFAFSVALHVTDVRPGIVRGIRSLLLVLMSWLLPVATLIVGGFVVSLPFVGLEPLWATRHATSVLLGAMAVLVLLINATFQGGELGTRIVRVLRIVARLACLLLLPMVLVAIYSLSLRVQQYGWSIDRVFAAACLVMATCYATGYFWAAIRRDTWLARIAPTNIVAAFVMLALLILLFSPVGDPARLSVASQLARLDAGKVMASAFDYNYLRFEGKRYGMEALQLLKERTTGPDASTISKQAGIALNKTNRWDPKDGNPVADAASRAADITVWPRSAKLPDGFLQQDWKIGEGGPDCLRFRDQRCDAYLNDVNGDGRIDVLLKGPARYSEIEIFTRDTTDGRWKKTAVIYNARCEAITKALQEGRYQLAEPAYKDLEIDGRRLYVQPFGNDVRCDEDIHR